ncbi:MAG: hypothetical protein ACLU38_08495 [Dysosmobacter sp.]
MSGPPRRKRPPKPTRTAVTGLRTAASRELDIRGMETLEAESVVETSSLHCRHGPFGDRHHHPRQGHRRTAECGA